MKISKDQAQGLILLAKSAVSLWGFVRNDMSFSKGEREASERNYQWGKALLADIEEAKQ